jgi:hypothetical protein
MKRILNFLFAKRKDGICRSWNHLYDDGKSFEFMRNTGKYVDEKPIQEKVYQMRYTCTKCGHVALSDIYRTYD